MASTTLHSEPQTVTVRRILLLQIFTLAWMIVECSVALVSAWHARSVALLAFGSDSFVEFLSASVVLLQFVPRLAVSPARAARVCGLLLYVLAGAVVLIAVSGLAHGVQSDTSLSGMAITAAALVWMPLLASLKRRMANETGNKALRADAVQSATCAYLAAITLAGLALRAAFGIGWLDSVAALAAVPILLVEARRARQGEVCGCHHHG